MLFLGSITILKNAVQDAHEDFASQLKSLKQSVPADESEITIDIKETDVAEVIKFFPFYTVEDVLNFEERLADEEFKEKTVSIGVSYRGLAYLKLRLSLEVWGRW